MVCERRSELPKLIEKLFVFFELTVIHHMQIHYSISGKFTKYIVCLFSNADTA